ncbi:MAG: bacteriorhodopsin [Verrucomicrobiota bacterium]
MNILLENPSVVFAASLAGGLDITTVTQYLFWVGTVAMAAGTAFFWLERTSVLPKYRSTLIVAGIVTAVAAFHYYRMANVYAEGTFPTEYRYIDWLITTPLLLIKFPLLLGLGKEGKKFLWPLIVLDVAMIVTAYIAEVSPVGSGNWWSFFIIACVFELAIVWILYTKMNSAIIRVEPEIASAIRVMRAFILIGWAIYPIGFLMALSGPTGGSLREIFYNVADVVNKVGFGLVAYYGIKAVSDREMAKMGNTPLATA